MGSKHHDHEFSINKYNLLADFYILSGCEGKWKRLLVVFLCAGGGCCFERVRLDNSLMIKK